MTEWQHIEIEDIRASLPQFEDTWAGDALASLLAEYDTLRAELARVQALAQAIGAQRDEAFRSRDQAIQRVQQLEQERDHWRTMTERARQDTVEAIQRAEQAEAALLALARARIEVAFDAASDTEQHDQGGTVTHG